jgi:hypothetical protein
VFTRIGNNCIGDILLIQHFKDKPQGVRFVISFFQKGFTRKGITFAEYAYDLLTNYKMNYKSSGVGILAASFINFGWWGGFECFIFGIVVGWLEVFIASRQKMLVLYAGIYILMCFCLANVFTISILSSMVKGGVGVILFLLSCTYFLEKQYNR